MISVSEAYNLVKQRLAEDYEQNEVDIHTFIEGPAVFGAILSYKDGRNGPEDSYVIDKSSGTIKTMFILGWPIEYPDYKSWNILDIANLSTRKAT